MIRTGTCNRCGQCCGADGSPIQDNRFPYYFPDGVRTWLLANFELNFPYARMVGLEEGPNGEVHKIQDYGNHNILGNKIYWRWVPDHAICKNLEPYDDPETYSLECPWLLPDPGDGTRPCVFPGTKYQEDWERGCSDIPTEGIYNPPLHFDAEQLSFWQAAHPLCSYTWEPE